MAAITATCATCTKSFIILDQEQKFLAEKKLPNPKNCPSCRQARRMALRGAERQLYKTTCQQCGKEIIVAFNPEKVTNKILCKEDFDQYFAQNDPIITDPLPI